MPCFNDLMRAPLCYVVLVGKCPVLLHPPGRFSLILEGISCPSSLGGGVTSLLREVTHSKLLCSPLATGEDSLHGSLPCSSSCCWCWEPEPTYHEGVPLFLASFSLAIARTAMEPAASSYCFSFLIPGETGASALEASCSRQAGALSFLTALT